MKKRTVFILLLQIAYMALIISMILGLIHDISHSGYKAKKLNQFKDYNEVTLHE